MDYGASSPNQYDAVIPASIRRTATFADEQNIDQNWGIALSASVPLRGFTYKGTIAKENLDSKNKDSSSKIEAFRA